jgi:hypothetical protein
MKHAIVKNIPKNPRAIFDKALAKSFNNWIDEKGTKDNPGLLQRKSSKLSYEQAFQIIQDNKPHWVISFRNESYLNSTLKDFWEFGGCNISSNNYGEVFIWINVDIKEAEEIFKEFGLKIEEY